MSEITFEFPEAPQFNFLIDLQGESLYQKWLELELGTGDYAAFLDWLRVKGDAGEVPVIGANGNWYIGGIDSGLPTKGADGRPLLYTDLTPEQLAELQAPAIEAAVVALQASEVATAAATQLVDGAESNYNTLKKLQDKLKVCEAVIGNVAGDDDTLINTVRELLAILSDLQEGVNLTTLLAAKFNVTDIYNSLDCITTGKALDARQGKVLKDLCDGLQTALTNHNHTLASLSDVTLTETIPTDSDSLLIQTGTTVKKTLFSTLKTWIESKALTFTNLIGFSAGVKTDILTKLNGSGSYVKEDGGTMWHESTKWFTQTGTFSSNGTTVTTTSGQLTSAMIGAKIGSGTDKRVIVSVANGNSCTVDSAFSTNYAGVSEWGVWNVFYKDRFFYQPNKITGRVSIGDDILRTEGFLGAYLGAWFDSSNGIFVDANGHQLGATDTVRWATTDSPNVQGQAKDTGLRRFSAGVLEIFDGITNGVLRDLKLRSLLSNDWNYADNGIHDGDLIGDRRTKVVNDVEITERCAITNASVKGSSVAGAWLPVSNQLSDNTVAASAAVEGCTRYRPDTNSSYVEICMKTGATTYQWIIIKQINW